MPRLRPRQVDFTGGEWSTANEGRVDIDKYFRACRLLENAVILHSGAAQRRPGTRYVATTKTAGKVVRLVRFEFSTTQAYVLEFGHQYIRFYANSGQVTSGGVPVEVATTYQEAELDDLHFTQSADVLHIFHPAHAPATLSRFSATLWRLADISFTPPPSREYGERPNATVTAGGLTGSQTFTASAASFLAGDVGRNLVIVGGTNAGAKATITAFTSATEVTATITADFVDVNAITAGDWKIDQSPQVSATPSDSKPAGKSVTVTLGAAGFRGTATNGDTDTGRFLVIDGGSYEITRVDSTTQVTATIRGEAASYATAPAGAWSKEEAAWSSQNGYPHTGTFTEGDRLALVATTAQPQTSWLSKTGDYYNFGAGVLDDDAVIFTLNTDRVNAIRWVRSARSLLYGTSGEEFITQTTQDAPITPTNITAKAQTTHGSSATVDAIRIDSVILFATPSNRKLHELVYDYASDRWVAPDLTLLADHLTRPVRLTGQYTTRAIRAMAYQREPISTLWCVREDGTLLSMTYVRDQNIVAWARHLLGTTADDTSQPPVILTDAAQTRVYPQRPVADDGVVESVCVIPHPDEDRDQVWVSVVRTVNGSVVRSIEYLDDKGHAWDSLNTDATITYDGTVTGATLTPGATTGAGVTFTTDAATFTASHVGCEIRMVPNAAPRALITSITDNKHAVATILSDFSSTATIAAGAWGLAAFTFTGITHLVGRTVKVVGDGAVLPDQVVDGTGAITNATATMKVEVGLGFTTTLVTVRPEFSGPAGTAQGVYKGWASIIARFKDTLGATVNGHELPWRTAADAMGAAPALMNGDKEIANLGYDRDGRLVFQQTNPGPWCLELITGILVTGD